MRVIKSTIKLAAVISAVVLTACTATQPSATTNWQQSWRYATDPHGSKVIVADDWISEEQVSIAFERVPRVDPLNNSWVELIYDLPSQNLDGADKIKLTYQSDQPLIIKLSQKEYGGKGDKSYAHYQIVLPAARKWQDTEVSLTDFSRPSWTPDWSTDKGLLKANISALYFVPDLTDQTGGKAKLAVRKVELN